MPFANETPLEDFLKYIKDETRDQDKKGPGIPIYVDPVGLNQAEKTMTSPIVIDLEDIPVATVLELALRELGMIVFRAEGWHRGDHLMSSIEEIAPKASTTRPPDT